MKRKLIILVAVIILPVFAALVYFTIIEKQTPPRVFVSDRYKIPIYRDDKNVYVGDRIVKNLDPNTVELISGYYLKDENDVYYFEYYYNSSGQPVKNPDEITLKPLPGADPSSFERVGYLAKDKKNIYKKDEIVDGPDAATFEYLGRELYRDKNNIFNRGLKIITGDIKRDVSTFQLLPAGQIYQAGYSKDWNGVYYDPEGYYGGTPILDADPMTFSVLTGTFGTLQPSSMDTLYTYATDSAHAYFEGQIIDAADPTTFEVIENGRFTHLYAKDNHYVYFRDSRIPGANPNSFEVLWEQIYEGCGLGYYAKDNSGVYFQTKLVLGANPLTFKSFIGGYGKDEDHVFLDGVMQNKLHPATFEEPVCNYG